MSEYKKIEPTRVGYWRPRNNDEHPAGLIADMDERDVARAERGEYISTYVSPSDLAAEGVSSRIEYLRARAVRSRRVADEIWALPTPEPGALHRDDAARLADWLDGGDRVASYRGSSICRVCGAINGSRELSRAGYVYPSGLSHYVRDHGCRVPGLPDDVWSRPIQPVGIGVVGAEPGRE